MRQWRIPIRLPNWSIVPFVMIRGQRPLWRAAWEAHSRCPAMWFRLKVTVKFENWNIYKQGD